jgi:hypothetical protein
MKKNLTIIAIALLVLAMAIPASAASLSLDGEYSGKFTYDNALETEFWSPQALQDAATLKLNLTFKEGDNAVAYLPLTANLILVEFLDESTALMPKFGIGSWYFAYDTAPWAFWASKNDSKNAKKFASLGDPLGLVATTSGSNWALNASGKVVGADANLYTVAYPTDTAWLGRVTYPLPFELKLGLVGAYTNIPGNDDLVFGADLTGKIPVIDADLTLAGAGYWFKDGAWKFDGAVDNVAYMAKIENIKFEPVSAWVKYTAVGKNFVSPYATMKAGTILKKYAESAAAEVEVKAELPVGIPTTLTLGDTLWMDYPVDPKWNETTGKVELSPLENLKVTVSGAYKADLNSDDTVPDSDPPEPADYKGYKAHADAEYSAFGLTFKPYADYKVDSYAEDRVKDEKRVDTIVGLNVNGAPFAGLDLNVEGSYWVEDPKTNLLAWGVYTTELNPGFVKSAKTQIAGVASYKIDKAADISEDEDAQEPKTEFYAYAGSDLGITDKLNAKVGVLSMDEKGKIAATAGLTYAASDSISTGLTFTYRQFGIEPDEEDPHAGMWRPFEDEGTCYLGADVTGTVGESTITLAYGNTGLVECECDDDSFHIGKPWDWMYHHPGTFMNWQLVTLSVKVPF